MVEEVLNESYVLVSPCRNEETYMRRTIDSVIAQTVRPSVWVIVDDGSTDTTPQILSEYASKHSWIHVFQKPDRGHREVGPGVIEAFYFGLSNIQKNYPYLCKLDLDLELPNGYFEGLLQRMKEDPSIGTCSGKPYIRRHGKLVSERRGDEMSVGMTKFYNRKCFDAIGGFVHEVMWDAIDCHKARQLGWRAISWDDPDLRFEHLRPMGSSQASIYSGRRRHGFGQYFMGSDPIYFIATAVFRAFEPPYITGGLSMLLGFFGAMSKREKQLDDLELRRFIRKYQRRSLIVGRKRAIAEIDRANENRRNKL